ncbi:hypothetical protein [Candidatus Poriferisodalis sp.]|uniref:hypothetical protein n=1 Tax=Candidatus Poriferisodalis sp. TaxID=3101277 RepID=UPI003B013486
MSERARIEALTRTGTKPDEIARLIGRNRSTVYRDLGRGRQGGVYCAEAAQQLAGGRARRPRGGLAAASSKRTRRWPGWWPPS